VPSAPTDAAVPPARAARSRGRRAGGQDAREQIVQGARAEFADRGYGAASLRGVARRAGVDPALVRYYFRGGKGELFAQAVGERAIDPGRIATDLLAGGLDGLGARLVERVVGVWDEPGGPERFRLIIAAAASGQGPLLADFVRAEIIGRVAAAAPGPDAELRASLAATQVAGLLVTRYVLQVPAVVAASPAELARRVGPAIQAVLVPAGPPGRAAAPEPAGPRGGAAPPVPPVPAAGTEVLAP